MRVISTCPTCGVEVTYISTSIVLPGKEPPRCANGHRIKDDAPEVVTSYTDTDIRAAKIIVSGTFIPKDVMSHPDGLMHDVSAYWWLTEGQHLAEEYGCTFEGGGKPGYDVGVMRIPGESYARFVREVLGGYGTP